MDSVANYESFGRGSGKGGITDFPMDFVMNFGKDEMDFVTELAPELVTNLETTFEEDAPTNSALEFVTASAPEFLKNLVTEFATELVHFPTEFVTDFATDLSVVPLILLAWAFSLFDHGLNKHFIKIQEMIRVDDESAVHARTSSFINQDRFKKIPKNPKKLKKIPSIDRSSLLQ